MTKTGGNIDNNTINEERGGVIACGMWSLFPTHIRLGPV